MTVNRVDELLPWNLRASSAPITPSLLDDCVPRRRDKLFSPGRPAFDRFRPNKGIGTWLHSDSTPGRDALCAAYGRRYRVDLRQHTRRSGFRGLLGSLAIASLHASQRQRHDGTRRALTIALGRSNWLFAGSLRADQRAAAVMSLIQSAKLNGHDPYAYLRDVLARPPTQPNRRLDELLPHRWQPRPA